MPVDDVRSAGEQPERRRPWWRGWGATRTSRTIPIPDDASAPALLNRLLDLRSSRGSFPGSARTDLCAAQVVPSIFLNLVKQPDYGYKQGGFTRKDDLKDMKDMLEYMEAALKDAERRSVTEELVRLWLNRLKNAAYDISYMLDEFQANNELASRKEETDRMNVLSLLSTSNNNKGHITVLPICGLGGIGKSTLAQLVFNDTQFKDYNHRVWVYVSQVFDLKKIGNSIISQVLRKGRQNLDTRELIDQRLKDLLQDKKTLIVLDDIWETDNFQLDQLKLMLNVGSKMKVLVTTRSKDIARKMCTVGVQPYFLDPLDNDMCWRIIKQNSGFESRVDKGQAEPVGQTIARKCGGLPLAAQALGFLLSGMDLSDWKAMCNNDIWDEPFSDSTVLPSLKLTYNTLTPYLRLCFAYCGIFPKGHKINKDDLIHQWIALGFIEPSNNFSAIQLAEKYIRQFLGMSFLQHSKLPTELPKIIPKTIFTMHDLVHDLARSIITEELVVFDAKRASSTRRKEYCCYASLTNYNTTDYNKARKMSTIFPSKLGAMHFFNSEIHGGVFSFPKCLRVLDLSGCSITEFPSALGQVKQLEVLIAPNLEDRQFPESITQFSKLHYLNLSGSDKISAIPSSCRSHTRGFWKPKKPSNNRPHMVRETRVPSREPWKPQKPSNTRPRTVQETSVPSREPWKPQKPSNTEPLILLAIEVPSREPWKARKPSNTRPLRMYETSVPSRELWKPQKPSNTRPHMVLETKALSEEPWKPHKPSSLDLTHCWVIESLPETLGSLKNLQTLNLRGCNKLEYLPESLGSLKNLQTLDIGGCSKLEYLPESLENLVGNLKIIGSWKPKNHWKRLRLWMREHQVLATVSTTTHQSPYGT
ncbi:Disease resistance protein RGA2 [Triticum urartu]|uniref:Disease resistance protein RGA2 n=2 Tax=Triticum urartu TaxID=4572 RepID=M7ZUF3_TRIUA|nr:Disease resistance protein RGA2 [Triticum urartu]